MVTSAVHPRSRGEHRKVVRLVDCITGSSPLARGTRGERLARLPRERFIPARAGNTPDACRTDAGPTVHPRSRGEHPAPGAYATAQDGSSPLARGTRHRRPAARRHLRFIPARAGNTTAARTRRPSAPVHPRSRGEHGAASGGARSLPGSSPLARGTRRRSPTTTARAAVHPRSRGEHSIGGLTSRNGGGSSPLARGTRSIH